MFDFGQIKRAPSLGAAMGALLGGILIAGPASAQGTSANYINTFSINSDYSVFAGALLNEAAVSRSFASRSITSAPDLSVGENEFSNRPYFFEIVPPSTASASNIFGVSRLDDLPPTSSRAALRAVDPLADLHFVMAVDAAFATQIVGAEFATVFADFSSVDFAGGVTETDFIVELLNFAGIAGDYGLTPTVPGGNQTNLLFDFQDYLNGRGGSIVAGSDIALVAFSIGQTVGSGTIQVDVDPLVAAVPEPSSWALMILGFGAVGLGLRRRASPQLA